MALQKVKEFAHESPGKKRNITVLQPLDTNAEPLAKVARRSERVSAKKVTPSKGSPENTAFTGQPPLGAQFWTKSTLVSAMDELRDTKLTKPFLQKVVAVGKTEYHHINSIYIVPDVEGERCRPK